MSLELQQRVFHASRSKGTARLLLVALAFRTNKDEPNAACFPSIERLARDINASTRYVRKCLSELESLGELKVIRGGHRFKNGKLGNRYKVTISSNASPEQEFRPESNGGRNHSSIVGGTGVPSWAEQEFHSDRNGSSSITGRLNRKRKTRTTTGGGGGGFSLAGKEDVDHAKEGNETISRNINVEAFQSANRKGHLQSANRNENSSQSGSSAEPSPTPVPSPPPRKESPEELVIRVLPKLRQLHQRLPGTPKLSPDQIKAIKEGMRCRGEGPKKILLVMLRAWDHALEVADRESNPDPDPRKRRIPGFYCKFSWPPASFFKDQTTDQIFNWHELERRQDDGWSLKMLCEALGIEPPPPPTPEDQEMRKFDADLAELIDEMVRCVAEGKRPRAMGPAEHVVEAYRKHIQDNYGTPNDVMNANQFLAALSEDGKLEHSASGWGWLG